jgi:hypothetical protein
MKVGSTQNLLIDIFELDTGEEKLQKYNINDS